MSKKLKRDICDLRLSGILICDVKSETVKQHITTDLQYACRYWVYHLQQSYLSLHDHGEVHEFLKEHFLQWLEVLSLTRQMPEGVRMVISLRPLIMVRCYSLFSIGTDLNNTSLVKLLPCTQSLTIDIDLFLAIGQSLKAHLFRFITLLFCLAP
jgi:hypothetical protein